jgi:peptidoglycan/LPS O-acetylase OafA/YrhL
MPTSCSQPPRVAFAHLGRGLAAGAVLWVHFDAFWTSPATVGPLIGVPALPNLVPPVEPLALPGLGGSFFLGHLGVALFFLISGFVIPFAVVGRSRLDFLAGRLFRIGPAYGVALAISLLLLLANSELSNSPFPYGPGEIVANALLITRWPSGAPPIIPVTWTLEVEAVFYAVCVILIGDLQRLRLRVLPFALTLLPLTVAFTALSLADAPQGIRLAGQWLGCAAQFVCFISIGTVWNYRFRERLGRTGCMAWIAVLFVTFAACWYLGPVSDLAQDGLVAYGIAVALFGAAYRFRNLLKHLPTWIYTLLSCLSVVSYPLYLVHVVVGDSAMAYLIGFDAVHQRFVVTAIGVAAATTTAALLHLGVERPLQRMGRQRRLRSVPALNPQ